MSGLAENVVSAIADYRGVQPKELDLVLYDHVDIEAAEKLLEHSTSDFRLVFSVQEMIIQLDSEGTVIVSNTDDPDAPLPG